VRKSKEAAAGKSLKSCVGQESVGSPARPATSLGLQMARDKDGLQSAFQTLATKASCWVGSKWAFAGALFLVVGWAAVGPHFRFSDTWQLVVNTATTIVTFLTVFLIQNSQNRDARALHLKLDEIIRAIQPARNEMIDIEKLSDEELEKLAVNFQKIRVECESRTRPGKQASP
jgi:low affinity Fe/Cu permease